MTLDAAAILVAAGGATRMGAVQQNKVYLPLAGRPVLAHALAAFDAHPRIQQLVVVVAPGEEATFRQVVLDRFSTQTPLRIAIGGDTRQDSVRQGVRQLDPALSLGLVHDGARPLITSTLIDRILQAADEFGAAVPGLPLTDSVKRVDAQGWVIEAPDRQGLHVAQTPQGFRVKLLKEALAAAAAGDIRFTDDAGMVAHYAQLQPRLIPGEPCNLKITTPFDLQLADWLYRQALAR